MSVCKCSSGQSSPFTLFCQKKVMGRKNSFLRYLGNENLFLDTPPVSSENFNLCLKN